MLSSDFRNEVSADMFHDHILENYLFRQSSHNYGCIMVMPVWLLCLAVSSHLSA